MASRGDILVFGPGQVKLLDVGWTVPTAPSYLPRAAHADGWAASQREQAKHAHYARAGSSTYAMVPLIHEAYGRLGKEGSELLNWLGQHASTDGTTSKRVFVFSALGELGIAMCRAVFCQVKAYSQVHSRVLGRSVLPGLAMATAEVDAVHG